MFPLKTHRDEDNRRKEDVNLGIQIIKLVVSSVDLPRRCQTLDFDDVHLFFFFRQSSVVLRRASKGKGQDGMKRTANFVERDWYWFL